jgi:hypothetical protein
VNDGRRKRPALSLILNAAPITATGVAEGGSNAVSVPPRHRYEHDSGI